MFEWRKLFRKRPHSPIRTRYFTPVLERLEDRYAPTIGTTTWKGVIGNLWSNANNWTDGLPDANTVAVFDKNTSNSASVMDLKNNPVIAGLTIDANYTNTITLQTGDLTVDVLQMNSGTIIGTGKNLHITQAAADGATNFGNSSFSGGKIALASLGTAGDSAHDVTLYLAGGTATPDLEANLTTDKYTNLKWRSGNMTVGGGNTITLKGIFTADSTGKLSAGAAKWFIDLQPGSNLTMGKGDFGNVELKKNGGTVGKVASLIPGGNDVFVVEGDIIDDGVSGGTIEVQSGTLRVQGDFTQTDGSTTVDAGTTLSVTGTTTITGAPSPIRAAARR